MHSPFALLCHTILEQAMQAQVGLRVRVSCPPNVVLTTPVLRARQALQRVKKELEPKFNAIQTRLDNEDPDRFLWVFHNPRDGTETDEFADLD